MACRPLEINKEINVENLEDPIMREEDQDFQIQMDSQNANIGNRALDDINHLPSWEGEKEMIESYGDVVWKTLEEDKTAEAYFPLPSLQLTKQRVSKL